MPISDMVEKAVAKFFTNKSQGKKGDSFTSVSREPSVKLLFLPATWQLLLQIVRHVKNADHFNIQFFAVADTGRSHRPSSRRFRFAQGATSRAADHTP